MAIYSILDPVFFPLLELGPLWGIIIISLVLSVLITLVYKWMTDQNEMKRLKGQIKKFQADIKENRKNPKKAMEIQKRAMEVNSQYMMKSMKPTFVTFLPILIIFGWLAAHMAFFPIQPSDTFAIEAEFENANDQLASLNVPEGLVLVSNASQQIKDDIATWQIEAKELGEYEVQMLYNGSEYMQKVKVSNDVGDYEPVEQKIRDDKVDTITTKLEKVRPFGNFSFFGWRPNWLWTYIIFSMIFSLSLRKAMKLY